MRQKYIEYDYESTFDKNIRDAEDNRIKELLDSGKIKSVYATKTIRSGKQFEVEIYPEFTKKEAEAARVRKPGSTGAQRKLNEKNARKYCKRLINTNFGNGDYWITLTYDNEHLPDTIEEAIRDMTNYIRRVNYRRKKEGLKPVKYIFVTEQGAKTNRIHHHLVIEKGNMTADALEELWKKGSRNNVRRIAEDENGLAGLSEYLTKDPKGRKRWHSSKNLKKPKVSKSYSVFPFKRIRKMIENNDIIKDELEKTYKGKRLINTDVRYNEHNGRFYIYAQMITVQRKE